MLSSKNDVYRLDNQDKVRLFAGQKVKITGTLESKSKTIHVVDIEARRSKPRLSGSWLQLLLHVLFVCFFCASEITYTIRIPSSGSMG